MKILIIEDEYMSRSSLQKFLSKDEFGFELVETANNGEQGLRKFIELEPEIVLTDIVMPKMTGIEMAEKIKEIKPACEIVFLSGYSEKNYLKSAIKIGAVNFVEKPVVIKEIRENILEAIERVNKGNSLRLKAERLETIELAKRISSGNVDKVDLAETYINKKCLCLKILEKESEKEGSRKYKEFFKEYQCLEYRESPSVCVLYLVGDKILEDGLHEQLVKMINEFDITVLQGSVEISVNDGFQSYNKASKLERQLFTKGYKQIVTNTLDQKQEQFDKDNFLSDFEVTLRDRSTEHVMFLVKEFCYKCKIGSYGISNELIKDVFFNQLIIVNKLRDEVGIRESKGLNKEWLWSFILRVRTIDELKDHLIYTIKDFKKSCNENRGYSIKVRIIRRYIMEHFNDRDLSVRQIADAVGITPEYLSHLFKQETDKTVNQYISEVRIDYAKDLLKDQKITLHDVAVMSGFSDAGYLSKKFKKHLGKTPTVFRKELL